jgi:Spy/CpxP family protein refolding chaperone
MKLNRTLGLLLAAAATVGAGAAVAAAATTSTTPTAAAATTPAPGGRHWHHRQGGMLVGVMLRATRQLNLTADQQTAIKGILSTARAQHQAAAGTAGVASAGVDIVALGNPGDPNYAAALQNAKTAAANRLQKEVDLQGQIYNVLTADQKAKLPQVLADMKSKAEQRRAAWTQQHGAQTEAAGSN